MLVLTKEVVAIDAIVDYLRRGGETVDMQWAVTYSVYAAVNDHSTMIHWLIPSIILAKIFAAVADEQVRIDILEQIRNLRTMKGAPTVVGPSRIAVRRWHG